jgi:hypothetical protein
MKQRQRSARNDPKIQTSLTPGEIESDLSEQLAKAKPSRKQIPFRITIVFNSEEERHNLHKCVTDDGTTNIENSEQFGPSKLGRTGRIACDRRAGQFVSIGQFTAGKGSYGLNGVGLLVQSNWVKKARCERFIPRGLSKREMSGYLRSERRSLLRRGFSSEKRSECDL